MLSGEQIKVVKPNGSFLFYIFLFYFISSICLSSELPNKVDPGEIAIASQTAFVASTPEPLSNEKLAKTPPYAHDDDEEEDAKELEATKYETLNVKFEMLKKRSAMMFAVAIFLLAMSMIYKRRGR